MRTRHDWGAVDTVELSSACILKYTPDPQMLTNRVCRQSVICPPRAPSPAVLSTDCMGALNCSA